MMYRRPVLRINNYYAVSIICRIDVIVLAYDETTYYISRHSFDITGIKKSDLPRVYLVFSNTFGICTKPDISLVILCNVRYFIGWQ